MKGDIAKSAALNDFPSHHRPFINKPDPEKKSSLPLSYFYRMQALMAHINLRICAV